MSVIRQNSQPYLQDGHPDRRVIELYDINRKAPSLFEGQQFLQGVANGEPWQVWVPFPIPNVLTVKEAYDAFEEAWDIKRQEMERKETERQEKEPRSGPGLFHHAGDLGDVIYALPTVRGLGGGTLLLHPMGFTRQPMNRESVELLRPLLEAQPYVDGISFSRTPAGFDLNGWRSRPQPPDRTLADFSLEYAGLPRTERDKPWLQVGDPLAMQPVILHRSAQYRGENFPWKRIVEKYGTRAIFVGLEAEHAEFRDSFGSVAYYPTKNLLELARVIAGAKLFIGNQSCPYAISVGLGNAFAILEQDHREGWRNCNFARPNAIYANGQPFELPEI